MRKLALLALAFACHAPPAAVTLTPARAPQQADAVTMPETAAAPERVLYRGTFPAWAATTLGNGRRWSRASSWLHGVDAFRRRAYVSYQRLDGGDGYELADIDLASGTSTVWVATSSGARMRAFHPMSGPFAGDLARYATMVERTGPFVVRARDYAGPHLVVSKDHIAYEVDPDQLMIARRDGSGATRLDGGQKAAYDPIFSPDGSRVAFTACNERTVVPPGAFYRCVYHVYVARIGGAATAYDVTQPQPPTFSADGRYVYAASRDIDHVSEPADRGGCADQIDLLTGRVQHLECTTALRDVGLETGERAAVFHGERGKLGEQIGDFDWLELPSGRRLGRVSVDRAASNVSYGGGDYLFVASQKGIVAVDLRSRTQGVLAVPELASTWISNQWKSASVVYALRSVFTENAFEILELDAKAILAQSAVR